MVKLLVVFHVGAKPPPRYDDVVDVVVGGVVVWSARRWRTHGFALGDGVFVPPELAGFCVVVDEQQAPTRGTWARIVVRRATWTVYDCRAFVTRRPRSRVGRATR